MLVKELAAYLWGPKAKAQFLFICAAILLFTLLGSRDLWTQEHRWAEIVVGMFYRQDFLHPYIGQASYYDKPLLSYWLIALTSFLTGEVNMWALRVPTALSGLLALFAIYRLGKTLKNKELGLLAGWLLLTTYYFLFWARTSSADMMNLAGSLFAVSWYMEKRNATTFIQYFIFFIILSLTGLCKGLVGVVVPLLCVFVDLFLQRSIRFHCNLKLFSALLIGIMLYLLPFIASQYIGGASYAENGLYLVYRENILRFFQPFDHQGSIYTYFIYLPIYLLPWAFFLIPALINTLKHWPRYSLNEKWLSYVVLILFLFFSLSGSRRSYYILPLVPFALLWIANWMLSTYQQKHLRFQAYAILISAFTFWLMVDILPAYYYKANGVRQFALTLKKNAEFHKPWSSWQVVLLDSDSSVNFYLRLPPETPDHSISGRDRKYQTIASLLNQWPMIKEKKSDTIFITRLRYLSMLRPYFQKYQVVGMENILHTPFSQGEDEDAPIAFLPKA